MVLHLALKKSEWVPPGSPPFSNAHRERLNTPNHNVLLGHVLGTAHTGLEAWGVSITGYRHRYLHAIGHRLLLKLSLGLLRGGGRGEEGAAGRICLWVLQLFKKPFPCISLRSSTVLNWGLLSCPIHRGGKQRLREAKAFAYRHTASRC